MVVPRCNRNMKPMNTITRTLIILFAVLWTMSARAQDQIFVVNSGSSTVGKYDATTGEAINANFITGAGLPTALALLDDTLFVANQKGTVGKFNATTGEAINASFITGLEFPTGLAAKSPK